MSSPLVTSASYSVQSTARPISDITQENHSLPHGSCSNVLIITFSVPCSTHICQMMAPSASTDKTHWLKSINMETFYHDTNNILNIHVGAHKSIFTDRSCLTAHTERDSLLWLFVQLHTLKKSN
jgi:hypothetical protein